MVKIDPQISRVPPIIVNKKVVTCVGDENPALGHPKIFINVEGYEPVRGRP